MLVDSCDTHVTVVLNNAVLCLEKTFIELNCECYSCEGVQWEDRLDVFLWFFRDRFFFPHRLHFFFRRRGLPCCVSDLELLLRE